MQVLVIDLGIGNIRSLTSALSFLGASHVVSGEASALAQATHAILPGVGAFDAAMEAIGERSMMAPLRDDASERGMPLLGVCLGMQLLCEGSDEGSLPGLGLAPGRCIRLEPDPSIGRKVPHVGFSQVDGYQEEGLFNELGSRSDFYFTHSYALPALEDGSNVGLCGHGKPFVAAFQSGKICGAQFHPEKSQSAGLRLLSNFLDLG